MFTPNFTTSQSSGLPNIIVANDSSTGSDVNISQRRIFLLKSDGTYLVPTGTTTNYVQWALANSSINLDVLKKDMGLTITVQWLNVNNVVLYTSTISFGFTAYNETFYYGLTQGEVPIVTPNIINTDYYQNKMLLRVWIDSGNQSVSFASDIYSAQIAYDNATYLCNNQNLFF